LRAAFCAAKQSPGVQKITSGKEQERPRNDEKAQGEIYLALPRLF
jgi:hypothetical protein